MIKYIVRGGIWFFALSVLSSNAFAEFAIYTIDNKFEAVFPASPQFAGELGEGKQKHRSYNYTDESNLVVYTATYQVGNTRFKKSDVSAALNNYVKGQALVVGGSVESFSAKAIKGNDSAVFLVNFRYQGISVRKYGVVSYKDGHFYQWAVQDFPSMSALDGKSIFNTYLANFSVK